MVNLENLLLRELDQAQVTLLFEAIEQKLIASGRCRIPGVGLITCSATQYWSRLTGNLRWMIKSNFVMSKTLEAHLQGLDTSVDKLKKKQGKK